MHRILNHYMSLVGTMKSAILLIAVYNDEVYNIDATHVSTLVVKARNC